ncbi:hypothetical protein GGR50DRAFT_688050 [Xylaria sp. CBS 124048]|nr:hypothetical protein GGR50DRAFT_688050 [Xylaria sp. CBS 124048]
MRSLGISLIIAAITPVIAADVTVPGRVSLYTSSWDAWDHHVARWSQFEAPTFSAVFKPENEEELSQGLALLSRNNVRYLATKGGGHGNVPTLGAYKDVVQVNLENFRDVTVNSDHTVAVGGGAKMIDLIPTLHASGREMTVGSFPCVGVHGVLLGGGMGRLMGKYGLISDAMLKAKVALWNGTIVEASNEMNPDLFWGLRGAGHNLGVVIESTFKTWPDKGGMHYNADMIFTDDSIEGVIETSRSIIEDGLDPGLFLIIGYVFDTSTMKPVLFINIVYAHDEEAGSRVAARFKSTRDGAVKKISRVHFQESVMDFAELGSGKALPNVCDVNLQHTLHTTSTPTLFSTRAMKEAYESYGSFMRAHPQANRSILLFEAASGDVINALPADFSAYAHRGKMTTNVIIQASWDDQGNDELAEAASAWGKKTRDTLMTPEASGYDRLYAYVNYANKDEPLSALYGYEEWRHRKLTALKQKYDPHGFFNAYRPIPLEESGWDTPAPAKKTTSQKKDEL